MNKSSIVLLALTVLFLVTCSTGSTLSPASENPNAASLSHQTYLNLANGSASAAEVLAALAEYRSAVADAAANAVITVPKTGRLLVTLRDNNAGWRSELFMSSSAGDVKLFEDTRQGPLNVTTPYPFQAGASVGFYLVTYAAGGGVYTNDASSALCQINYLDASQTWVLSFEDNPNGDADFNDAVVEVKMDPDSIIDLSSKVSVSVEYLNYHGTNEEGLVIYYIGETMAYNVHIAALEADPAFTQGGFTVYAIHEYLQDETCNRWWYNPPAGETQLISVLKGDPLPGQNPPQKWTEVNFTPGSPALLSGSHYASLATAAGNDQTHVLIVRENALGEIELTVYDNPEAGIFDPPAPK